MQAPLAGRAAFLTSCVFIGLGSLALVMTILEQQAFGGGLGNYWYLSTLVSPAAGKYYLDNAERTDQVGAATDAQLTHPRARARQHPRPRVNALRPSNKRGGGGDASARVAAAGRHARALRSRGVYGPGGGARGSGGHRHRWKRTAPIAGHAGALAAMGEVFFLKSPLGAQ